MIERSETQNTTETVISGSFRKHLEQISSASIALTQAGITVLAPDTISVVNPDEDFAILASDDSSLTPVRLETNFMRNIRKADFLYVVDTGGYIGKSAATEMAYAGIRGLPIILAEEISFISSEIPDQAQSLLRIIAKRRIPIDELSKEKIDQILEQYRYVALSSEDEKVLSGIVRDLIRELNASGS